MIRRPVPEEPSAQRTLFQMGGYTYQAMVTNLALQPLNLWRFYNQRARAELIIRELKYAYALGKIPNRRLPDQRGVLPDRNAGLQLAELVQTSLCPTASAADHPAASSPAVVRGAGPIGATGWSSNPPSGAKLSLGLGLLGDTEANSASAATVLNPFEEGAPEEWAS